MMLDFLHIDFFLDLNAKIWETGKRLAGSFL